MLCVLDIVRAGSEEPQRGTGTHHGLLGDEALVNLRRLVRSDRRSAHRPGARAVDGPADLAVGARVVLRARASVRVARERKSATSSRKKKGERRAHLEPVARVPSSRERRAVGHDLV